MFDATCSVKEWHRGANTHLGTIFLFAPLAASASLTSSQDVLTWRPPILASTATHVVKNSSSEDAIWVYRSLEKMGYSRHGQIESMEAPDAFESNAINELKAKNITLHDVMKTSSRWDRIASEMVSGYPIALNIGVPAFHYAWERFHDVNMTTVHIFLQILSEFPDLMIARKVGLQYTTNVEEAVQIGRPMSESVSLDAKLAIKAGGLGTREGIHLIRELDARLRQRGNLLNPGSTADITAATLMIMLLSGWRP